MWVCHLHASVNQIEIFVDALSAISSLTQVIDDDDIGTFLSTSSCSGTHWPDMPCKMALHIDCSTALSQALQEQLY